MPQPKLSVIIILGLFLRVAYAVAIYEPSLLPYLLDDYVLYRMGAEAIAHGDLSFTNDLFLLRPPLYPVFVAALSLQPLLIISSNIFLASAIIPLSFGLARRLGVPERFALLASFIVAMDPTSIKYSGVLVAEPLANLLLTLSFLSLTKIQGGTKRLAALSWGFMAGGFIVLSALTRPASYLLWLPMAVWAGFARRAVAGGGQQQLLAAGTLLLIGFGGTWLWMNHNATIFGHRTYTTIGNYNMLYYRAASVLHQATGQEIDAVYAELARRVEARLGNDTVKISDQKRHEHYTGSPQLQSAMTAVAIGVFRDHPLHYALTIPAGLFRLLLQVNGPLHWIGFVWNLALIGAAALGLSWLIQAKNWTSALFLALPSAYFMSGTLLVQTSGIDTRARVMITPLIAIMAVFGVMRMLNRRRTASASLLPPVDS